MRRKGELSAAAIDRQWPYQVALPADRVGGSNYDVIRQASDEYRGCPRGHSVVHDGVWYQVFCFSTPQAAAKFQVRFGGEPFNPKHRGRGRAWSKWNKPPTAISEILTPAEIEARRQLSKEMHDYATQKLRERGELKSAPNSRDESSPVKRRG